MASFLMDSATKDFSVDLNKATNGGTNNGGASEMLKRFPKTLEPIMNANLLLTLLVTQRKLCVFEVGTDQDEESR